METLITVKWIKKSWDVISTEMVSNNFMKKCISSAIKEFNFFFFCGFQFDDECEISMRI